MEKVKGRGIQTIEIGNRLLLALMSSGSPMMLRDLAAKAGIGAAQAHAYLSSFRRAELVEQEAASGRYILGPATNRLASARMDSFEPMATINAGAAELANKLGLLVALLVWGPQAPTAYRVHDASQGLNINLRPGTTFSIINSAGGRVFGAFDDSDLVEQRIEEELVDEGSRGAGGGRATRSEFERARRKVRTCGYAYLPNSPVPGLSSLSAPVMSEDGKLVLAVTLVGSIEDLQTSDDKSPRAELLRFISNS